MLQSGIKRRKTLPASRNRLPVARNAELNKEKGAEMRRRRRTVEERLMGSGRWGGWTEERRWYKVKGGGMKSVMGLFGGGWGLYEASEDTHIHT